MEIPCRLLIEDILNGNIKTRRDLEKAKRIVCNEFKLEKFMTNSQILEYVKDNEKEEVYYTLQKKPTRTISGVAIVAVMCHPHKCPHGRCLYCPESDVAPPSYTGEEPAALRARMFNFDPYQQTYQRLKQLDKIGHPIDKVELIIMGGTFPSRDLSYQEWFISSCLKAMNDYKLVKTSKSDYPDLSKKIDSNDIVKRYPPNDYVLLDDSKKINENSDIRCVGMTFETRPDYCKIEDVNRMLNMGVTRVELGVQTTYDFVYRKIKRGHSVGDVIDSTRILKDSGIKVGMHLMPGLFSDPDMDMRIFKRIFNDDNFKPDMIKIYPTLVTKGSELYKMWMDGKYQPYTTEEAIELIVKIKKILPKWVRTMRIQRDIPSKLIKAGIKKSNLGELVYNKLKEDNIECNCIRCREIGHNKDNITDLTIDDFKLFKQSYNASNGCEIFLSYEDKKEKFLTGFLRLRIPSKDAHRTEINNKTAIIRELHIYGNMMKIGDKNMNIGQHRGYGEKLVIEAEKIAISHGKEKLAIMSGIGARNYYKKFGYNLEGPYMVKSL
ncbi:MAG: tRNA uridine(34) 5-carboxymethylaminomethyl modification radical SAM/GNAT enzyme Elp3 [Methanobrevibacter sp.]|jgi:elongator complex protein 3|nr:tRNA uridine(34) 5-carboxymethylaminomethyl modification radical SAM/GNAT enzyme Elp3 [Candidatus Methanovirga meridionalis]